MNWCNWTANRRSMYSAIVISPSCNPGETADAKALGAFAARRESSNLSGCTKLKMEFK